MRPNRFYALERHGFDFDSRALLRPLANPRTAASVVAARRGFRGAASPGCSIRFLTNLLMSALSLNNLQ